MSHILECRCFSENLLDPSGVTRVACIGDSMMYGFGGPSRDSFPSHLMRVLNAAYPDRMVLTENFGHTSGNIWKSWPLFKARAELMRFDAVVFSICQNDLELFESNLVRYGPDRLNTFLDGTPTWKTCCDMLGDIVSWRASTKIDVLLMFFTYHPGDRPMIDRVAAQCSALDLPFVDMLGFYQSETAIAVNTYRVSEFDGHPSGMAHQLAARRVGREFLRQKFLASSHAVEDGPASDVNRAISSMTAQGVPRDAALEWAREMGQVKSTIYRRMTNSGNAENRVAEWGDVEEAARYTLIDWRNWLRRDVRAASLESEETLLKAYFPNLAAHRRNVEELLYVLLNATAGTDLSQVLDLFANTKYLAEGNTSEFDGDIGRAADIARKRIDAAMNLLAMRGQARMGLECGLPLSGVLPLGPEAGLERLLANEILMLERQVLLLEGYAAPFKGGLDRGTPEFSLLGILLLSLQSALLYVDRLTRHLEQVLSLQRPHGLPWTIVLVSVEGAVGDPARDKSFDLIVHLTYAIPRRLVVRERQLAGALKERATYRFEFPLMITGNVEVGLDERGVNRDLFTSGKARFSRIEVGNADWDMNLAADGTRVVWETDGEARANVSLRGIRLS